MPLIIMAGMMIAMMPMMILPVVTMAAMIAVIMIIPMADSRYRIFRNSRCFSDKSARVLVKKMAWLF
ncbi:MAG: hypothetical protein A3G25_03065 [Betaproteobacteria bacterium RIFCSPLOWO2_12_FULL_63_13]|nr:MAG: hypothetical protein A3G25_03065 [Betaproteobacteria bacterium RIFCSPLOWO2_12_FULL_63_13]